MHPQSRRNQLQDFQFLLVLLPCFLFYQWVSGQDFQPLGGGVTNGNGGHLILDTEVDHINGVLYVSGIFAEMNNIPCNCIARWDGVQWDSLGSGAAGCLPGGPPVRSMVLYKGDLYAAGSFRTGVNFARWNGATWDSIAGFAGTINGFLEHQDTLWALGSFEQIAGVTSPFIIKYDGQNWHSFVDSHNLEGTNFAAAAFYKGELYVGGNFWDDDLGIEDLAKWNGQEFERVGTGIQGSLSSVGDMLIFNDRLYVSGLFSEDDGSPGNSVMAWDGSNWDNLQGGVGEKGNPTVYDLNVL
ncbi:MAG: hypothetical protein ACFB10_20375, partial [Salibacteraceae bacterium]